MDLSHGHIRHLTNFDVGKVRRMVFPGPLQRVVILTTSMIAVIVVLHSSYQVGVLTALVRWCKGLVLSFLLFPFGVSQIFLENSLAFASLIVAQTPRFKLSNFATFKLCSCTVP